MSSEIKIDINEAIEQLATKLGMASGEILPLYTKRAFIQGVIWIPSSLIFAILPWFSFFYTIPAEWGDGTIMCHLIRIITCIAMSWVGGFIALGSIENLIVPKAIAIKSLLEDIRGD